MTRKCFVKDCNSRSGLSFFSFPDKCKYTSQFKKLVEFCGISQSLADIYVNSNSKICEKHFSSICFNFGKIKTLKKAAVPTIYDTLSNDYTVIHRFNATKFIFPKCH